MAFNSTMSCCHLWPMRTGVQTLLQQISKWTFTDPAHEDPSTEECGRCIVQMFKIDCPKGPISPGFAYVERKDNVYMLMLYFRDVRYVERNAFRVPQTWFFMSKVEHALNVVAENMLANRCIISSVGMKQADLCFLHEQSHTKMIPDMVTHVLNILMSVANVESNFKHWDHCANMPRTDMEVEALHLATDKVKQKHNSMRPILDLRHKILSHINWREKKDECKF